jgi:hypothetical protein
MKLSRKELIESILEIAINTKSILDNVEIKPYEEWESEFGKKRVW